MESSDLISETTFVRVFTSFWRSATPMSESFVRRVNLELYERVFPPLGGDVTPERRGFVNEIAFGVFRLETARKGEQFEPDRATLARAVEVAREFLGGVEVRKRRQLFDPTEDEVRDILEQAYRMDRYFRARKPLIVDPCFPGCGFIEACQGDILAQETLYEVKAGERWFRSIDIRQLLTYTALNLSAESYRIIRVGGFNPRMGIAFEVRMEDVCNEISGMSTSELLSEIVFAISRGDASR